MAIATMGITVFDCPHPRALADFYAAVVGGRVEGEGDWVTLAVPGGSKLAFQEAPDHVAPDWPAAHNGQQLHLDLYVPEDAMDEAERRVLELGARLEQGDDGRKRDFRVYRDPAGHPFCLCYS
jgi:hypothetical protein